MDYVKLGRSALKVSRLCLGTMNFGPLTNEPDSFAIMDKALGVGLIPWSPLGGGLLGGILRKVSEGRRTSERIEQAVEKHRGQLEAYDTSVEKWANNPPILPWPGCCTTRWSPPPSLDRARWSSLPAVCGL